MSDLGSKSGEFSDSAEYLAGAVLELDGIELPDWGEDGAEVAQAILEMETFPTVEGLMQAFSVEQLQKLVGEFYYVDSELDKRLRSNGLIVGGVSFEEGSEEERQIAQGTLEALAALKADVMTKQIEEKMDAPKEPEPAPPNAPEGTDLDGDADADHDGHEHGPDTETPDDEDAPDEGEEDTPFARLQDDFEARQAEIKAAKGWRKKTKLRAKMFGDYRRNFFPSLMAGFASLRKIDTSEMGFVEMLAEYVAVFTDGFSAKFTEKMDLKKKEAGETVNGEAELFTGTRHKISSAISFGGKKPRVTSPRGPRYIKDTDRLDKHHNGVDLADETPGKIEGTPIVAEKELTVFEVKEQNVNGTGAGHYVKLKDAEGNIETLMHLQAKVDKPVGYTFKPGEVIARVGKSGTKHAHLHYETETALEGPLAEAEADSAKIEKAQYDAQLAKRATAKSTDTA